MYRQNVPQQPFSKAMNDAARRKNYSLDGSSFSKGINFNVRNVNNAMVTATSILPRPTAAPIAPVAQMLAAVAVPRTDAPSLRMAPPPMKPMPVISPSTTRAVPSGALMSRDSVACMKPQLANATSGKSAQPSTAGLFLAIPSNRQCQGIGKSQRSNVRKNLKTVQDTLHRQGDYNEADNGHSQRHNQHLQHSATSEYYGSPRSQCRNALLHHYSSFLIRNEQQLRRFTNNTLVNFPALTDLHRVFSPANIPSTPRNAKWFLLLDGKQI